MLLPNIAGAEEYYEYTKELDEAEAKALKATDEAFTSVVGVEAPDDYTLVYHCRQNVPYFVTLCTAMCLMPLPQGEIDELGVDGTFAQNNQNMWYNGPYTITEYIAGNSKTLTRNPHYWDTEAKLFDTVTVKMVEDGNMDDNLFLSGEVDRCDLSEAKLRSIYENEDDEFHDNLVMTRSLTQNRAIQFNFNKLDGDGNPDVNWNTAVANEAFRLSLYYGMELTPYWARTNFINPAQNEALNFTTHNVVAFSDGTDYADRVIEKLGLTGGGRYDAEKAEQYKQQAIEELTAKGVTFPVEMSYYVPANNQDEIDKGTVLKEVIEALGTDYVTVNIETYVNNARQEVYNPHLHSFGIAGWTADYGDPENFISQFMYDYDGAYFANNITMANDASDPELIEQLKEYTELCRKADTIYDDMDARYEAQADAETYLVSHALIIPCYSLSQWSLTKVNTYSQPYASYGGFIFMYKNFETRQTPYTTGEYDQFKAAYDAEA